MWSLIYSFLIGGGAARLAETRPLTEERVVRPPPCVRDPTGEHRADDAVRCVCVCVCVVRAARREIVTVTVTAYHFTIPTYSYFRALRKREL